MVWKTDRLAPFDPDALEQFLRPTLSDHRKALIRAIYATVYPKKPFRIWETKPQQLLLWKILIF